VADAILLLDDDDAIRLTTAALLEDAGFRVIEATSLADARKRLAERTFTAHLFDLNLPDGTSLELIAELRQARPSVKIALYSGDPSSASGADLAIEKGGDPEKLLDAIRRWLG
jgi:DNA-binding response OmpR family regulator